MLRYQKNQKKIHLPLLSFVLFATIFVLSLHSFLDYDIWFHLETGEYIVQNGSIPQNDIFSHSVPNQKWFAQSWLSEVLFYTVYVTFGLGFIILLKALLLAITSLILFKLILKYNVNVFIAFFITIAAFNAAAFHSVERPLLFTFLFVVLFLYVIKKYLDGSKRWLYLLPILMLLWVNLHAGFVFGFAIIFIYILSEVIDLYLIKKKTDKEHLIPLSKIFLICALFALINPNFYEGLLYPLQYFGTNTLYTENIAEWSPPDITMHPVYEFVFILLAILSFILSKRPWKTSEILMFLIFLHLSLTIVRNIPIFVFVVAPIVASHFDGALARASPIFKNYKKLGKIIHYFSTRSKAIYASECNSTATPIVITTIIIFSFLFYSNYISFEINPDRYPVYATQFLEENHLQGNMYNHYAWGGYIIWKLYPEYKVFVDGRIDMYGQKIMEEYHKLKDIYGKNWNSLIEKYNITYFIIPTNSDLANDLENSAGWEKVYFDKTASIFQKKAQ